MKALSHLENTPEISEEKPDSAESKRDGSIHSPFIKLDSVTFVIPSSPKSMEIDLFLVKHDEELEYEKVYFPLVMLGKKRYIGKYFSSDPEKGVLESKGISLKRRDNCKLVKTMYTDIINIFLEKYSSSTKYCREYIKNTIESLKQDNIPIEQLILSKTLKKDYKLLNMAHKKVVEKIFVRELKQKNKEDIINIISDINNIT